MERVATAETAVDMLAMLEWLFYGGSFYATPGARLEGGLSSTSLHP